MAQITLVTGIPGHGKTLRAIELGIQFLAEGRVVYAAGFRELDYAATGFLPLPTPFESFDRENLDYAGFIRPDWMLLEGAVILLDECYGVMPARASGRPVPVHIDALARHRHYNIDLILITQKHNQIDSFYQGLVNEHVHVRRRFGLQRAVLKTFDGFESNPTKAAPDRAPLWKYPKHLFGVYKSATEHSVKRKLPWFIWAPIPLLFVIFGAVYYVKSNFGKVAPTSATAPAGAGVGGGASGGVSAADEALRHANYGAWLTPRVSGQPWTAPAYDRQQVQSIPRLFCAAVEDATCHCITEQGTKYRLDLTMCRAIARDGVYNPFLPDEGSQGDRDRNRRPAGQQSARVSSGETAADLGVGLSAYPSSSMRRDYVPPQLSHAPGG